MASNQQKIRWGDVEDDSEDLDFLLPPKQADQKVDEGNTTIRKGRVVDRQSWPKFGDAVHDDVGARLTVVSTEDIILERHTPPGSKQNETKARIAFQKSAYVPPSMSMKGRRNEENSGIGSQKSVYVPPSMKGGEMRRRNEENSIRITNLSEETREADLLELFRVFGHVSRVHVAMDQKSGMSRGFGFVNFVNREDAERAINKLNGYGYDNLILRVEWATTN